MEYENFEKAHELVKKIKELERSLASLQTPDRRVNIMNNSSWSVALIHEIDPDDPLSDLAITFLDNVQANFRTRINALKRELSKL